VDEVGKGLGDGERDGSEMLGRSGRAACARASDVQEASTGFAAHRLQCRTGRTQTTPGGTHVPPHNLRWECACARARTHTAGGVRTCEGGAKLHRELCVFFERRNGDTMKAFELLLPAVLWSVHAAGDRTLSFVFSLSALASAMAPGSPMLFSLMLSSSNDGLVLRYSAGERGGHVVGERQAGRLCVSHGQTRIATKRVHVRVLISCNPMTGWSLRYSAGERGGRGDDG
jgi:hypothetical protein